ncbi:MAG: hypothetical protein F4Y11_09505, partial [Chloroflexi bacterium]|nr:hypothetical protein [Chloroflexota bacterium]
ITVTVDASHTQTALPFPIEMTPGDHKITVEWALLDYSFGSVPIAYQVRHRLQGTTAWTESDVMLPRAMTLDCDTRFSCSSPRRHEITGLLRNRPYEVELRARNANGWSEWHSRVVSPGPPDNDAPVAQSAVNTSGQRTVVITFNEPLNPAFQPNASRFQLGRQDGKFFTVLASARATNLSINGSQLTVTFSQIPSDATHIEYVFTFSGSPQDYAGNVIPSFRHSLTRN